VTRLPKAEAEERYTSVYELGRGGMGVVFAAFDAVRQEHVALKRLSTVDVTTPAEMERATLMFEREYRAVRLRGMIEMGVVKQIAGTPAFIAPACLNAQPLGGQTDLFALGAGRYCATETLLFCS
jgi:serine/threonine protein kinase